MKRQSDYTVWKIFAWYLAIIGLTLFLALNAEAQVKQTWDYADIVDQNGQTIKSYSVTSSLMILDDTTIIISCNEEKLLGLISSPMQGVVDDTDYRVYKWNGNITIMKDSIKGNIYRRPYISVYKYNQIIVMTDDSLSFMMIHPNPYVALAFHNKYKNRR